MRDPEHWARLLVPVDVGTGTPTSSMLLRTSPSSEALAREPLERALWARRLLGTTEAPEGVEFTLAQGTGIVFRKRFSSVRAKRSSTSSSSSRTRRSRRAPESASSSSRPGACIPAEAADKWTREPQAIAYSRGKGDATANARDPADRRTRDEDRGPVPVDERSRSSASTTSTSPCSSRQRRHVARHADRRELARPARRSWPARTRIRPRRRGARSSRTRSSVSSFLRSARSARSSTTCTPVRRSARGSKRRGPTTRS
jgi:hypothetical protein